VSELPESGDERLRDPFRLRPGELLGIVAFWAFLAILTAAGPILDPRLPISSAIERGFIALAFVEYSLWALLTVPIVAAVNRIAGETHRPARRALYLIALGLVVAIVVDTVLRQFRLHLLPPPPNRANPTPFGNLLRFEFLDDFMVYAAVAAAAFARNYFIRLQLRLDETRELRARLAEAQLGALRMQLNPHFLFNTLNAVATLVESDPKGVRRMIARLSDLLRHTLEKTSEQEIIVTREIELVRRFVEIMEVRFQGSLDVRIEVDPAAADALVPNMILQPLVENAFRHGVSQLGAGGRVTIRVRRDGDDVVLSVRDNGPGPASTTGGTGVGLANTRARLDQLYGARYFFSLHPAPDGTGAVAEIRLPYHV
jgi:two-component system LytT family sensor kinase